MAEVFGAKVQLTADQSQSALKKFRTSIQQAVNDATSSNPINVKNIAISLNKSEQKNLQKSLQQYFDSTESAFTVKIQSIDASPAVDKLRKQLEAMLAGLGISGVREFVGDGIGTQPSDTKQKTQDISAYSAQLKILEQSANSAKKALAGLRSAQGFEQDNAVYTDINERYTRLLTQIEQVKAGQNAMTSEAILGLAAEADKVTQLTNELKQTNVEAEKAKNTPVKVDTSQAEAPLKRVLSLYNDIERVIKNTPKLESNTSLKDQAYALRDELGKAAQSAEGLNNSDVSRLSNGITKLKLDIKEAGIEGRNLSTFVEEASKKFGGWYLVSRGVMAVVKALKDMVNVVIELDTAMTELRKVTNETMATYDAFVDTAAAKAKQIGASLVEVVQATADYARMGYSIEDSTELAEVAILYRHVADGIESIDDATAHMISTMKGFGIVASDAMSIADKINEVANKFPVTGANLGEILSRSAAAMAAAGNTLDETLGLAVGAQQVLQNDQVVGGLRRPA